LKFQELNKLVPYVTGGKPKVLSMHPYNAITLRMPGRHAEETTPVGGDFVVCVDDADLDWIEHQFTHDDIFNDVENKFNSDPDELSFLMKRYCDIICGDDPEKISVADNHKLEGLHPQTFFYAVQCLAVAEHRRYARFEEKFGGRYLPFRFAAGIAEELWSASDAIGMQKKGRPGVEMLEKFNGVPVLTKELMNG
jgi:hypothetical protein